MAAQTITAGLSGGMTRVELNLERAEGTTHPLVVELRDVAADGGPGDTVLASASVSASAIPIGEDGPPPVALVPAVFGSLPQVLAGNKYAVVLRASDSSETFAALGGGAESHYAGGSFWANEADPVDWHIADPSWDLAFKTYVDPTVVFDPACSATGSKTGYHVIRGTGGNDVLNGTAGRDLIYGFGGDDVIKGRGGGDLICGGSGNDTIVGGNGYDVMFGGVGDDTVRGGARNDRLSGGDGNDLLAGRNGRDALSGGKGNDVLRGGNGADHLFGDAGDDTLRGNRGDDELDGGSGDNDLQQ